MRARTRGRWLSTGGRTRGCLGLKRNAVLGFADVVTGFLQRGSVIWIGTHGCFFGASRWGLAPGLVI
jgi:hypothetical protein